MNIHQIDWNAIEWVEVRPGVARKGFSGNGATVALHRLAPGHEPKPHSHPNEQIVYIIEGTVKFHIGSETTRLGPGMLALVPRGVEHYAEVVGDQPVLNLDVFTPAREEYGKLPSE